jgi:Pilin (bacterial filament)
MRTYLKPIHLLAACSAAALVCAAAFADPIRSSAADRQLHDQVINNALGMTAKVRQAVENYRLHHNAFPSDSADIGLNPASWTSEDIKQVTVGANGMIEITLAASSGVDGGVIRLTPTVPANTDQNTVDWACTTPSYNAIADTTSGFCEYSKLP